MNLPSGVSPVDITASPGDEMPPFFEMTDKGNGERLAHHHGKDLRFIPRWGSWVFFNGKFWEKDEGIEIVRRAKDTVSRIKGEEFDPHKAKFYIKSQARRAIDDMIRMCQSEPGIAISESELDTHEYLLNCANGTLDLKTGKLKQLDRADYLTKCVSIDFNPGAKCPVFEAFLNRIFANDENMISFIRRAIGYSLTGMTVERCLFILYGIGRNGKSTLLDIIQFVLGEYAMRTPTQTLIAKQNESSISNDVARLRGSRFVYASETEEKHKINESFIKDLTGGDMLTARFMRAEFFQFKPECKVWLGTNHKPRIKGTDEAIWDRIRLIPFSVRTPDSEIDRELPEKLRAEAEGILAWAVRGCLEWQEKGLAPPDVVKTATNEYRQESDILGQFFEEKCELGEHLQISKNALFAAYEAWARSNVGFPLTKILFGKKLRDRGIQEGRATDKTGERTWQGIAFKYDGPEVNF